MNLNQVFSELDDMMRRADIDKVIPYLEGKCKEAETEGDGGSLVSILNELVGFCRETCQYEKAMEYAAQALQVIEQIGLNDTVHHATTFLNIANCLRAAGRLTDSLNTYHKVEAMYQRMIPENDFGFASLYNNESLLYQELEDFEGAYISLQKALGIVKQYPEKEWELAVTYANLANTCLQLKHEKKESDSSEEGSKAESGKSDSGHDYSESKKSSTVTEKEIMEYADKSIELFHKLGETDTHIAAALVAKGQLMERQGDYDKAISCYEEALTAIKTTLGETDFFRRVMQYLSAAVRRSGHDYDGEYKDKFSKKPEFIKGLEIDREYYENIGRPMLEEKFIDYFSEMTIGMFGEGSDCFGFDDSYSMDHDWGPGFYIWLESDLYKIIGEELQREYDALPADYRGYKRMNTEHGRRRIGVSNVDDFCSYYLGKMAYDEWKSRGEISSAHMLEIPEYKLAAFCNGMIFKEYGSFGDKEHSVHDSDEKTTGRSLDTRGTIIGLRTYISEYYDKSTAIKLLCQRLAEFGQNAQYNYPRMKKRGDSAAAMQLLHTGLRRAVQAAYILNKLYAPHDKWLMKGTESFNILKDIPELIKEITIEGAKELLEKESADGKADNNSRTEVLIDNLAAMLLTESIRQDYIGNTRLAAIKDSQLPDGNKTIKSNDNENGADTDSTRYYMDTYLEHYTSDMMYRAHFLQMSKEELVEEIARMEFEAFDEVKNEGGRAECQDDWTTFHIMRASQYNTWTYEMLVQYAVDFSLSMEKGWNPIMEKYGRMEESTSPEEWNKIKDSFPVIPPEKKQIMEEIIRIQVEWMEAFSKEYPGLASHARRIHTSEDMPWDTSYETYLRGEMGTYSDKMLKLYGQFIVGIVKEEDNLAYRIMNETIRMYGYSSFEEAMKKQETI